MKVITIPKFSGERSEGVFLQVLLDFLDSTLSQNWQKKMLGLLL